MATFTMTLADILGVDSPDDADPTMIGLKDYPIWDEGKRDELNKKIIMRFWNREIGFETVPMFTHNMRRVMGEIMPYYNQLAKTTFEFDPFETIHVVHESESESHGEADADSLAEAREASETSQTSSGDTVSRSVNSEHPQTRLNEYENYATSSVDGASENTSQSSGDATGTSESKGKQTSKQSNTAKTKDTQRGFQGNRSVLMQQYRDLIIGVENQILNELETLFMGVWDTDQAYTRMEPPILYANPFYYHF